jgi:hypothetical protein
MTVTAALTHAPELPPVCRATTLSPSAPSLARLIRMRRTMLDAAWGAEPHREAARELVGEPRDARDERRDGYYFSGFAEDLRRSAKKLNLVGVP